MTDPYRLLGVSTDADDESVRGAYIAAVRACPPEHDPRRLRVEARALVEKAERMLANAVAALRASLAECVETAEDGKLRLAVTLPGMQSLDALAAALAKLMAARESGSAGEAGAA